ncbi:response regulator [Actinokineospora sp. NBRC 105648]|uniref:response regulator n=1 Tax=Actinokineospora sp. NBRC 105648 TaxID=3032206 RepID=UPI0024A46B7C|nr:response regulator [Actinokineospora sp. NBRC 105648]GLZ37337.1 response regulator [Actinokineospora sp. NBRC 105648]
MVRVLVVDDDEDVVEVLGLCLANGRGWDVRTATSGAAALEVCRSRAPDVVLLDVEMPVLDGPGVLAALRADPRTRAVPVVFVTAVAEPDLDARLRGLGAVAVLPKPFDPLVIGDQVALLLGW